MVGSTHLKNMLVKLDSFLQVRGENKKNMWNHHLVNCWLGARRFGIRIAVPLSNNPFHKVEPKYPIPPTQTTN